MDALFKALGDPARRTLLDALRQKDGQSLSDLEATLTQMSRFGVMKHLRVLEDAHLIVTRKEGRFKYHYLNALPLQEAIDRWIDPLIKPTARAVTRLKQDLERTNPMTKPDFMMQTFIDCTHDALWDALTKGELMGQYHFGCEKIEGDHEKPGDQIDMYFPPEMGGGVMLSNRVISIDPKSRIEMSFAPGWNEEPSESRCVYLLEPEPRGMKLTIEHYELTEADGGVEEGWARFAAGLKSWLETGSTVRFTMRNAG
ncbi:MAG: SRPBCC domain-containing protein [Pseudomonadota bacterium]